MKQYKKDENGEENKRALNKEEKDHLRNIPKKNRFVEGWKFLGFYSPGSLGLFSILEMHYFRTKFPISIFPLYPF